MNSIPFVEALKEFGRVIVLAIIPVLIDQLSSDVINWKLIAVVGAVAGLRALDKYLHQTYKDTERMGILGAKGLTGF